MKMIFTQYLLLAYSKQPGIDFIGENTPSNSQVLVRQTFEMLKPMYNGKLTVLGLPIPFAAGTNFRRHVFDLCPVLLKTTRFEIF
jgi:hypothetical protein